MKNRQNIFLYVACLCCLASCEDFKLGNDFLEKPLSDEMNIDSVFAKKVYSEQQLAQAYHSLPDYLPVNGRLRWGVLEGITDLAEERDGYYHNASLSAATSTSSAYSIMYNEEHGRCSAVYGIRQAYIQLENVDRVPDMTQEEKNIRKGEAMMIIAYHYVDMFRNLGGMPWVDHAYTPTDDMHMERMTIAEAVDNICGLIDQAAAYLPWTVSANDDGRMTKAGALALKSRLLTFAASPLYNNDKPYREGEAADKHYVWWGDYQKSRWEDALEAGLAFLRENKDNGDQYKLVDTYDDPCENFFEGYYGRWNFEILISSHRYTTCNRETFPIYQVSYGFGRPLLNYVDMFQMKNGEDFDWENPAHRAHPFYTEDKEQTRDPRLYETVWVCGAPYWGRTCEIYKGGREQPQYMGGGQDWRWHDQGRSGFAMKKLVLDQYTDYNGRMYNCPLMRLPEIYFNIAEAMNELGIAEEKDEFGRDAYDYINLVRARVEMPGIDADMVPPGEALREYLLDERAREFGYEEVRYFDIVRWMRKDYLEDTPRRLEIFPVEPKIDGEYRNFTYEIKTDRLLERQWVNYWDNKWYLCPLSQEDVNKKYGLVQNPGW